MFAVRSLQGSECIELLLYDYSSVK